MAAVSFASLTVLEKKAVMIKTAHARKCDVAPEQYHNYLCIIKIVGTSIWSKFCFNLGSHQV